MYWDEKARCYKHENDLVPEECDYSELEIHREVWTYGYPVTLDDVLQIEQDSVQSLQLRGLQGGATLQ